MLRCPSIVKLGSMTLDAETRSQLLEARKTIVAQLNDLEFRVTGRTGGWRRRGPQDAGDVYEVLEDELRQINELLGPEFSKGD
jgi:hypothetical protein